MKIKITLFFKILRRVFNLIKVNLSWIYTYFLFYSNNLNFSSYYTDGIPFIMIARGGFCNIGENLILINTVQGNPIGRPQKCTIVVDHGARLIIGDNVGLSATAIIVHNSISIGNNTKIGGGVCIYDTDFHSLDYRVRLDPTLDKQLTVSSPVNIHSNVFIGAHSTILKGVTIGENSIIGACSVVSKSVPANEIWAGNPAKFIKHIKS